jgi:glycosyltransferase involved in cell wall biosynthesis
VELSVLALCRYSSRAASSRQRFVLYRDSLKNLGINVTISSFFDDGYLLARYAGRPIWQAAVRAYARRIYRLLSLAHYDLLWVEKEMLPYLPAFFERFLFRKMPYVIDIDDAWYLNYSNHSSSLVRRFLGMKFEELIRHSALTLVGNNYLAQWARANGAASVAVVPTVVDLDRYPARPPQNGPFTIGWIGTPMTVRYLEHIAEPLREICDGTGAQLRIIGDTNFRMPGVASVSHPWQHATEAELISQCHIGIMPLPHDPWIHGKCGYKLVQFLAAGRAVIATRTEANEAIIGGSEAGFVATTDADWTRALACLRDQPELREQMGATGRRRVQRGYCLAATAGDLARNLFAAAGLARAPHFMKDLAAL